MEKTHHCWPVSKNVTGTVPLYLFNTMFTAEKKPKALWDELASSGGTMPAHKG